MKLDYESQEYKVDREAFEKVARDVEAGATLHFGMLGAIFGRPFYELIILAMMDAREAARMQDVLVNSNSE